MCDHDAPIWVITMGEIRTNIPRAIHRGSARDAFVSSACTIMALIFLFGAAMFPNLVRSNLDPTFSITIANGCSSHKTLGIMAIMAAIGLPFIATYTAIIYWVFRGRVTITKTSY